MLYLTNVKTIFSTTYAFAALKNDGTVLTWGSSSSGGDSSSVTLTNIQTIFSNVNSFAALKKDGTVLTWPSNKYGGNSSNVNFGAVK